MNIILFFAFIFLITFVLGRLLERIRIPWIFSALLIGLGLAAYNPFQDITSSGAFLFIAELGMYFLLFIIGFEIDLDSIRKKKKFIVKTTFVIILAEAFFGTLFVHYVFSIGWLIAALVSLSFATVGEAMLLPILDEFRLTKTKLGQTILGIGVLDDVIEVSTIIIMSVLVGTAIGRPQVNISFTFIILAALFGLAYLMSKMKHGASKIHFKGISSFFLFVVFFIFLFIGVGALADAAALGALLAGISLHNFIPDRKWKFIDSEIRTMAYGFFAPIFFLWVGLETDIGYLFTFPLLMIAVILLTKSTKIGMSYLMGRKVLGSKESIIMGISLSVKFSTSIVIIKILFQNSLIPVTLYSVLIGSTILFKFIVPLLLSNLIPRWKIGTKNVR